MISERQILLTALIGALALGVWGQTVTDVNRLCNSQTTCGDCIRANPSCNWCADVNATGSRCYSEGSGSSCSPDNVQNPTPGLGGQTMEPLQGLTQISPSALSVNLRVGGTQSVPVSIRPANNFPVDLYLLMDLSFSMEDDLDNLKTLGSQLAQTIGDISTNFRIGFGSFVDKRLAPFVNINPINLDDPCSPGGCLPPYSFRHSIRLTDDSDFFDREVQDQMISGNQDSPEGGFDGLMQAIVCTDVCGISSDNWVEGGFSELLLFITDAGFHFAGDGKLGGVVLPNDGSCRLTVLSNGEAEYRDWDILDYPSIGQIAEKLREEDIIPIFAAETAVRPLYDMLVDEIGEGAYSGELADDSSNVVTLVEDLYNEISQNIRFDADNVDGVSFSFSIKEENCPGVFQNGVCTGVQIDDTAVYDVGVTLDRCTPELSNGSVTARVRVVGFGSFEVTINSLCSCDCEIERMDNDAACNGNGTLVCGICECNTGSFGDRCQCDQTGQAGGNDIMCPLGDNGEQCSGRGTCTCGVCSCDTDSTGQVLYAGSICECDNINNICRRTSTEPICSGRGECTCEGCNCNVEPNSGMEYSGDFCECTPDLSRCIDPSNSTFICNGRGTCSCEGVCTDCTFPYFGDFCDQCNDPICRPNACELNAVCAACAVEQVQAVFDDQGEVNFGNYTIIQELNAMEISSDGSVLGVRVEGCGCEVYLISGDVPEDYRINSFDAFPCVSIDPCFHMFLLGGEDDTDATVHVDFDSINCPAPASRVAPWIIAIAILIPLLVLGLLALLLLKIILLVLDAIEVQKFKEELANSKYKKNENPLYQSAQKEYSNPMYGK